MNDFESLSSIELFNIQSVGLFSYKCNLFELLSQKELQNCVAVKIELYVF